MKPTITVIGSANIDYIMQVPRLPTAGETVSDGRFHQAFGGKGANQAVAAARAGGAVHLVASLGSDRMAEAFLQSLRSDGIDTTNVSLEPEVPGGAALIMIDARGENFIGAAAGANARLTPERVRDAEETLARSDWIILQQEIPLESTRTALELAAKHGCPVLMNYAPIHDRRLPPDDAIHGLVVNAIEAAALAGTALAPADPESAERVATGLLTTGGHRFVAITLGKDGVVVADESGVFNQAAFPANAIDTTGAGDTFCGALAVALGDGLPLPDAVRFAAAASALCVTKLGAQPSIPTHAEIEAFLEKQ